METVINDEDIQPAPFSNEPNGLQTLTPQRKTIPSRRRRVRPSGRGRRRSTAARRP